MYPFVGAYPRDAFAISEQAVYEFVVYGCGMELVVGFAEEEEPVVCAGIDVAGLRFLYADYAV